MCSFGMHVISKLSHHYCLLPCGVKVHYVKSVKAGKTSRQNSELSGLLTEWE